MTKRNTLIFILVASIFVIIGAYTQLKRLEIHDAQSMAVNDLFAVSLADSLGQRQPLAKWKGKTLVVNFWATWCSPCIEEIPELSALQNSLTQKNIQIIGIGIDSATNISEFAEKHKITYPIYVGDTQGLEFARKFGNQAGGLPFTVLIDSNGQIKKTYLGRLKLDELKHDMELQ